MIEFETRSYVLRYYKKMPRSFVGDYDYGDIRYPSGYNNKIEIYEKIMNITPMVSIMLNDDTVSDIKNAIREVCDNIGVDNNDCNVIKYNHITITTPQYMNCNNIMYITVVKLSEEENIRLSSDILLSFIFQNESMETETFSIPLNQQETEGIYNVLDDPYDIAFDN